MLTLEKKKVLQLQADSSVEPSVLLRSPAVISVLIGFPAYILSSLSTSSFLRLMNLLISFHWKIKVVREQNISLLPNLICAYTMCPPHSPLKWCIYMFLCKAWNPSPSCSSIYLLSSAPSVPPVYIIPTKYEYIEESSN